MRTYAFIDTLNLSYGGVKSLGWSIDYKKLIAYLKEKYGAEKVYFFGGVYIHKFPFDPVKFDTVPMKELVTYLSNLESNKINVSQESNIDISRYLSQCRFYQKLGEFGYHLVTKPVKTYSDIDGKVRRKANCDVDMSLCLLREKDNYERAIILSGDGDFLPILKYLREERKEVLILARGPRTAKEMKRFAGDKFLDFIKLRTKLELVVE